MTKEEFEIYFGDEEPIIVHSKLTDRSYYFSSGDAHSLKEALDLTKALGVFGNFQYGCLLYQFVEGELIYVGV